MRVSIRVAVYILMSKCDSLSIILIVMLTFICFWQGIRLELHADDRMGLLSDITRVLRENGLAVVRADVATQGEKAINAFYVRDISGNEVVPNMEFVESMKRELMGPSHINLQVKNEKHLIRSPSSTEKSRYFANIGDILKSQIGRLSFRIK